VWHAPHARFVHAGECFRASYTSNGIGARDRERERESHDPRVVVLGDSFVEGWGLDASRRMTDRLESATGVEHLNFGMAHFSPYQALLAYRHAAKPFDHSAVMIAILPENDFVDLDLALARSHPEYEYRYRPYLVATGSGFEPFDYRENRLLRVLRRHAFSYQAAGVALRRFGVGRAREDVRARTGSRFYDFAPGDVERLEFVLDELRREVGKRELIVLLLPVARDLRRYTRDGADPLSQRLGVWAERNDAKLLNLLPPMARAFSEPDEIAFPCDYHWNARAHATAAKIVRSRLAGGLYSGRVVSRHGRPAR
jgi:hypothetical protein